eukprot:SM001879S04120  [mRNA]  locus=s1879:202:635:+ [translate_table: standard]
MTPKMKGHKHDREAADRKERIQELMAKMPAMLDEYRSSSYLTTIQPACRQETARGHWCMRGCQWLRPGVRLMREALPICIWRIDFR